MVDQKTIELFISYLLERAEGAKVRAKLWATDYEAYGCEPEDPSNHRSWGEGVEWAADMARKFLDEREA